MRTLIIQLPTGTPQPSLAYAHAVVTPESASPSLALQWAVSTLLPTSTTPTETVVLVPALALSWHRVTLPEGLAKQPARWLPALQGVLEDRLLDDPALLHMALQPDWAHAPQPWVAVCDRAWLSAHLQALEQAGVQVHRIVPELHPPLEAQPPLITALGDADSSWLWVSHPERGIWGQALNANTASLPALGLGDEERAQAVVQAEPGVVEKVSQLLGTQARLVPPGQHWLDAIGADWDLAQFELRANAQTRRIKQLQRSLDEVRRSPAWRPVRWGLALLLATQLIGLNAWAWKTRADWQAQQSSWTQMLQETFPQTQVVVDAPLQMAQQVDRLRQSSGQLGAADLEAMLAALGQAMPQDLAAPGQWTYQTGQLRLQSFKPTATQQQSLQQSLSRQGYQWRAEGDAWLMNVNPTERVQP
jgi:general secretion pathway protein L